MNDKKLGRSYLGQVSFGSVQLSGMCNETIEKSPLGKHCTLCFPIQEKGWNEMPRSEVERKEVGRKERDCHM